MDANPYAAATSQLHKHDGEDIALHVSLAVLTTLSVILRFYVRHQTRMGLGGDDWLCLVGFVAWLAYFAAEMSATAYGFYKVPWTDLPPALLEKYLKIIYITPLTSVVALTFAKASILWLYWRLFSPRSFRILVMCVAALNAAYGIVALFVCIFKCTPIALSWNLALKGSCVNFRLFFDITEPFAMLVDVLIVFVPVKVIRNLQMPTKRKFQLSLVFAVGLFVTVVSIIRLVLARQSLAEFGGSAQRAWLYVQVTISLLCVSLPTYGPLMTSLETGGTRLRSWYTSVTNNSKSRSERRPSQVAESSSSTLNSETKDRVYALHTIHSKQVIHDTEERGHSSSASETNMV